MFSGIVETTGKIINLEPKNGCVNLTIQPYREFNDIQVNDSVAVNGVCLTVTHLDKTTFSIAAVPETLRVTNLGYLAVGSEVNLERSVRWNDRISGHCVQGHVDGVAEIMHIKQEGDALLVTFSLEERLAKFLVKKGYITIDGMSITVIDIQKNAFSVTLIPHTQQVTIAKYYKVGSKVNIEADFMAKYIETYVENFLRNEQ